jgi:crotonobetainyl-CoA:carnitine CoA-transferase CaiB-like acyl-CoA transferase
VSGPPPLVGEHTRAIAKELGVADDVLAALEARGAVAQADA